MPIQFITSVVFIISMTLAEAAEDILCYPCSGEECNIIPEGCLYGIVRDPCGRLACAAGPGERCGGTANILGKCGEGMTCKCGKCRGCSTVRIWSGMIECDVNTTPICN